MYRKQRQSSDSESDEDVEDLAGRFAHISLPAAAATAAEAGVDPRKGRCDPQLSGRLYEDAKKASEEDSLLFDPCDYDEDQRSQLLQKFFDTSAPSKVKRSDGIGRISVRSPSYKDEGLGDLDGLKTAWEELQNSTDEIDFGAVTKLARTYSCLGGIWLLFFDTGAPVDAAWEKIAQATVEDELGTHAKVTPCEDVGEGKDLHGKQHAISVYTADFSDKTDVLRVEAALRGLAFSKRIIFKPRVYSSLGVYSQNKWRLRPGIYTSQWDAAKHAWSIRDSTKARDSFMIVYK